MPHLRSIEVKLPKSEAIHRFPFTVPIIRHFERLDVESPVTFLVGENGSGKSTLLEALAIAANLPAIGSHDEVRKDATLAAQGALARALKLVWNRRTLRGFFLRAEDFFGYTKSLSKMRAELLESLAQIEVDYEGRSAKAKSLARMPFVTSLSDMERRYGTDLDENSHGQSFLKLFQSRFVPAGLYLLDEPEAPLSPQSQLALMLMMDDMLKKEAQFIIATHSPILLGFPGAAIYTCDTVPIARAEYEQLDHVVVTRDFLNGRERYLRQLMAEPE